MEKTIKYLENGEYHYATVKDVGDLAKLKTDSKDDLVTAINELFITGGEGPKKPDGYDELVDNVADAIQKQQQMTDTITNMQQSAQLSDAEMEHMKQVQEELHQEYLKAIKELNEAVDKAKADAADLDKKTSDLQDKLDETFASVDKEVSDVHKQLDSESAGLRKDLDDTKTSLESTRKDLLNNTQEFGVVNSEVKELKDKMDRRIWSTDLDPVREQVNKNTTEVSQTKDELKNKADQSSLDLVTNSVENLSTQVKENADGLKVSVKKDELGGDVARLLNDKTNLLLGTRSFSGEDNWRNRDKVTIEPGYYKGMKTAAVQVTDASIYQPYRVKANTAYTFSFFGKEDRDNPKATLVIKPIDAQNVNVDGGEQQVHITTEWQRFAVTFSVDQECEIAIQIIQGPEANNNILHLAGFKLQYGQNNTPWEPNEADVAENIEHTESQFNVYSDQIAGIVKKQEKMGYTERQLDTRITETAEGLKQTSKDLQDANGKITEFNGKLESTAHGLKTEYEKYTNEAVGQISDSSLNLIHNSAFSNQDDQFESWQNISAKATVREDSNNLHWVELTQSGQGTDNPIGVTSNYFIVKQGKVTVAVDVKLGDKANLDNQNILLLELYDENKKRVDFTDVSVSQLGLSMSVLNDHNVHRGLYRLGIDRKDVKYMTVKAILHRNGDLWLTNFSARLSSIDDGGYTPNPDDVNHQILKMNTKIEEDAEHIALKANSVDVTRDIKSAVQNSNGGGINLLKATDFSSTDLTKLKDVWGSNFTLRDGKAMQLDQLKGNGDLDATQFLPVEPDTDYTLSFEAYYNTVASGGSYNNIYTFIVEYKDQNNTTPHYLDHMRVVANTADRSKNTQTIHTQKDCHYVQVFFRASAKTLFSFWRPKLERGSVATPWSPAPEDTSAEIKSAKDAAIQVASDQINIHVNELSTQFDDKLNKRVNEVKTASEKFTSDGIEQVVKKVSDVKNQVDGIQIGGRNLLRGTSDQYRTLIGDGYLCKTTASDMYTSVANYHTGDWFTYAATITNNSTKNVTLETWLFDGNKVGLTNDSASPYPLATHSEIVQPGQGSKRVSTSFRISENTWYVRTYVIFDGGGAPANSKVQVKDERLVEGNMAGTWSPNPDDVDKKIDTQTLESVNIDDLKTQGHYFVHNLIGNPIGGWVYVDVIGNNNDRVRQDVYADQNNQHKYRSWNGSRWSDWEQGAYLSDVNSLKTEVTASVKNLGDRVTTEVNSITTKVNSNNGGGVNLQTGTGDCSFPFTANQGQAVVEKYDDHTKMIHAYGSASGFYIGFGNGTFIPDVGEKYTISADIKGKGTIDRNGFKYEGSDSVSTNKVTLSNNWQRISCTVHVSQHTGTWIFYPVPGSGNNDFYVKHIKIERGSVATPWSPAPEDTTDVIKTLSTKWDVANGQIQGKVTATDVNNILNGKGYATQSWAQTMFTMKSDAITLQAVRANITDGIQNQVNDAKSQINSANGRIDETNEKIDKAKIGERNLAVGTNRGKTGWTITPGDGQSTMDDSWVNDAMGVVFNNSKKSTSWWVAQYPFDMSRLKPNTFYTISFDIQTDVKINGNGTVDFARVDSTGTPFIGSNGVKIITEPGATTHVVCKYKTKGNIENNGQAFYLNSNNLGQANWVKIFNLMIVEGTQSIAWAAAPEDDDVKQKGVNLLKSSAYWSPDDWNMRLTDGSWVDDNWIDGLGHKAYGRKNGAWNGLGQTVYVTPGIYTWSAQIYVDNFADNDFVQVYMGDSQYNGTAQTISIRVPQLRKGDSDKWVNYSATFFVKNAGNLCVRPELNNAHGEVHVGSQKLEHGMVATPWTPSPLDDKNATITLYSVDVNNMKTQGHYFVRNLIGNPIPGWVYVDVTGNGNDRIKQDVYQDNGSRHKYRRWVGSWTEWVDDVNKDNILSQINISPEKIRLLSNKIEIDGNTYIHGTLNVPEVKLQGKSGYVDLSGDGINIAKNNGAGMNIGANAIQITSNTNGQAEVEGVITPAWSSNNVNQNGIGLILTTEQELGRPYGGDILTIGTMPKSGVIHSAMVFDATGITGTYKKGFNWFAPHTLNGDGGVFRFPNAQDDLVAYAGNIPGSRQAGYSQPTLALVHGRDRGSAGLQFQWDDLVPFGRINSSNTRVSSTAGSGGITVSWYSWGNWWGDMKAPAIVYVGDDGKYADGGIVFYPGGEVCVWHQQFRSYLQYGGLHQTD